MTLRAFRAFGVLRDDARVLGVGAGHEATIYWLTRHVGEVVATDLYETEDVWSETDSSADMLTDPGRYWDGTGIPSGSTVRHMAALRARVRGRVLRRDLLLQLDRALRRFRGRRRSVEEMFRVLRPGGILALATEFRLEGTGSATPACCGSTSRSCGRCCSTGSGGIRRPRCDLSIYEETVSHPVQMREAIADLEAGTRGLEPLPARGPSGWRVPLDERARRAGQVGPDRVRVAPARSRAAAPTVSAPRSRVAGLPRGGLGPQQALARDGARLGRQGVEVRPDHHLDQLLEADARLPAELALRLRRVRDDLLDVGRPREIRVDAGRGPRASGRRRRTPHPRSPRPSGTTPVPITKSSGSSRCSIIHIASTYSFA